MPIFVDNFTGVDGTLLQNRTSASGHTCTLVFQDAAGNDFLLNASNQLIQQGGLNAGMIYSANGTYTSSNYFIQVNMVTLATDNTDPIFLFVRQTDVDNMYAVRIGGQGGTNTCQLYKKVTGTWTALGSAFNPPANGSIIKLEIIGSILTFYDDGASLATATDTDLTSIGKAGLGAGGGAELILSGDDSSGNSVLDNLIVQLAGVSLGYLKPNKLRPAIFTPGIAR